MVLKGRFLPNLQLLRDLGLTRDPTRPESRLDRCVGSVMLRLVNERGLSAVGLICDLTDCGVYGSAMLISGNAMLPKINIGCGAARQGSGLIVAR